MNLGLGVSGWWPGRHNLKQRRGPVLLWAHTHRGTHGWWSIVDRAAFSGGCFCPRPQHLAMGTCKLFSSYIHVIASLSIWWCHHRTSDINFVDKLANFKKSVAVKTHAQTLLLVMLFNCCSLFPWQRSKYRCLIEHIFYILHFLPYEKNKLVPKRWQFLGISSRIRKRKEKLYSYDHYNTSLSGRMNLSVQGILRTEFSL